MADSTIDEFVSRFPRAGGFVYVLTNEAHPHLIKIGFTTRSPAERAVALDTTGTPHPFVVAFALYDDDPHTSEQRLHQMFAAHRVRSEREFFALPLSDAVALITDEFGENADYFDPNGLTLLAERRASNAEFIQRIYDRLSKARQLVLDVTKERTEVSERLIAAEAKLANWTPLLSVATQTAAMKSEMAELKNGVKEIDEYLESVTHA